MLLARDSCKLNVNPLIWKASQFSRFLFEQKIPFWFLPVVDCEYKRQIVC